MSYVEAKSKISETVRKNFEFYLRFKRDLSSESNWYEQYPERYPFDENGKDPIEVFNSIESCGKILPCNDVETLLKVLDGKRSINLHIKMWAEGIAEGVFFKWEIRESYPYFPSWVWDSINNQIWKKDPEGNRFDVSGFLYLEKLTRPKDA